jgi:RNA polymerase sigma factor (sigma-70 family)
MPFPSACSSFSDFKNREMEDKLMDNHDKKYTLLVGKKRIPVTQEVYKAYYHCRDREKYLYKLAEDNNISLEGCYEKGISVEYIISAAEDSMEDAIITGMLLAKLRQCLKMLDEPEKMLIVELYLRGKSERQLSQITGIPPMTIHDRKVRLLKKLKKMIER